MTFSRQLSYCVGTALLAVWLSLAVPTRVLAHLQSITPVAETDQARSSVFVLPEKNPIPTNQSLGQTPRSDTALPGNRPKLWPFAFMIVAVVLIQSIFILVLFRRLRLVEKRGYFAKSFNKLIQTSQEAVVITDRNFKIQWVNRMFLERVGGVKARVVGRSLFQLSGVSFDQPLLVSRVSAMRVGSHCVLDQCVEILAADAVQSSQLLACRVYLAGRHLAFVLQDTPVADQELVDEQLFFQAHYDPLTELPNRHSLMDQLRLRLSHCQNTRTPCAVLFLDLDAFGQQAGVEGHYYVDQLIIKVAERLSELVADEGVVSRLSGDQFVVLLDLKRGIHEACLFAQKLLSGIQLPFHTFGRKTYVTASVGLASFPQDATEPEVLLKNAQLAMLAAKREGRGRFRVYHSSMQRVARRRAFLELGLRKVVERNELNLVFQPVVDANHHVVSCEALLRWPDSKSTPSEFIPIAEKNGEIKKLGRWVLFEAARHYQLWSDQGVAPDQIAINVSASQLLDHSFVDELSRCYQLYPALRNHLTLEFTERVMLSQSSETIKTIEVFKSMGCRLALDDFGTGYSSLSYLIHFPFDVVKIDRSFVKRISGRGPSVRLIESMVRLAKSVSMYTIVEGVETLDQWQKLKNLGVDGFQGYGIQKCITGPAFAHFMKQQLAEAVAET